MLATLNEERVERRWSAEEAQTYLAYISGLAQQRAQQRWQLDLGLLDNLQIAVPEPLQPFCLQPLTTAG